MMILRKILIALALWIFAVTASVSALNAAEPGAGVGKPQILIKIILSESDGEAKASSVLSAPQLLVIAGQTATMTVGQQAVVGVPDKGDAAKQTFDSGISANIVASIGKSENVIVSGTIEIKAHNPAENRQTPTSAWAVVRTISVPFVLELKSGTSGDIAIPPAAGSKKQLSFKLTPTVIAAENAAIYYWQAFAALPKFDAAQTKLLPATNAPLDLALAKTMLRQSEESLAKLRKAASCGSCDWGLDFSQGPKLELPHLGKARELQRVALLNARVKLAQGAFAEAAQNIADVMILARHVGGDPLLINGLVMIAIEQSAMDVISPRLADLNAESLGALARALDNLPPRLSMSSRFEQEGAITVKWLRAKLEESRKDPAKVDVFNELIEFASTNAGQSKKTMKFDEKAIEAQINELAKAYAEQSEILKLPFDQAAARFEKLEAELNEKRNQVPLAAMIFPAIKPLPEKDLAAVTRIEMLSTALDILRNGKTALGKHRDPVGEGPFKFEKHGKGFTLTSKLTFKDKPLALIVGGTEEPLPKNDF